MSSVRNRKFRYEVLIQKEKRWIIECSSECERDAKRVATSYLSRPGVEAVKIIRYRSMITGFTTKSVIYECEGRPVSDADKLAVNSNVSEAPYCEQRKDLALFDARFVIRRMLKSFMAKHKITASELLYNWQWQRKINDAGAFVNSAIAIIGRLQAGDNPTSVRAKELSELVTQQERACREFPAEKHRLPQFDEAQPDQWFEEVSVKCAESEKDIFFMGAITTHLSLMNGYYPKLLYVFSILDRPYQKESRLLLEGLCADLLQEGDIVKDLFPNYLCRGEFLVAFAEFLANKSSLESEELQMLQKLIASQAYPQIEAVLYDHLLREIRVRKNFDKRDPVSDDFWLDKIVSALTVKKTKKEIIFFGGAETEMTLSKRIMFAHQERLRRIGLHDAADALPVSWTSPFEKGLETIKETHSS